MKWLLLALSLLSQPMIRRPIVLPAAAGVAHVQHGTSTELFNSDTSASLTMGSNGTSGNTLAVFISYDSTTITVSSMSGCGGTFSQVGSNFDYNGYRSSWWVAANITGGSCTITATLSAATSNKFLIAHEVSGVNTSTPTDGSILAGSTAGAGTDTVSTGNFTTTQNGDYIMGVMWNTSFGGALPAAGTGYTLRASEDTNSQGLRSENRIQTTASASTVVTFSPDAFVNFIAGGLALRP